MLQATSTGLRALPQVGKLLEAPEAEPLLRAYSRVAVTEALRRVLAEARASLQAEHPTQTPTVASLLAFAADDLRGRERPILRRAINATGIVLHTNLGRAPLSPEAIAAMCEAAGSVNLEFDLDEGVRGARLAGVAPLLCELTGGEAAVAVNNGAAAVLLALNALAKGGEIVVSRGELVEIGGGFRIPDVIRESGARLVEVGTTNKTRLADFEAAITADTRVLLKVHQSNYRIVGFTTEVGMAELAALAQRRGLLSMMDLGSGALLDPRAGLQRREPTVREAVAAGVDLVAFSGDKLLGGPQAGLIVGREAAVAPLRRHPLMRALRLDKVTLAALEATLRLHRDPARARQAIPTLRMLAQTPDVLEARARRLIALIGDAADVSAETTVGYAGGGTLPDEAIASVGVAIAMPDISPSDLARALRLGQPSVVGRLRDGRVLLDMLTVEDPDVPAIAEALHAIRAASPPGKDAP